MKLLSKRDKGVDNECVVQTSRQSSFQHPFYALDGYSPLNRTQFELYKTLREAVPVIDAAINKLVRLVGTFEIKCSDKNAQKAMDDFLKYVQVNRTGVGFMQFLYVHLDELLTYGTSVSEIVVSSKNSKIRALYNASLKSVELKRSKNPLLCDMYVKNEDGTKRRVKRPELICVSTLNPEPDMLYGESVLKGLPFVSSILLKIFNTIGVNFERVGNVRFAINYKPDDKGTVSTKHRAQEIAREWSKAMRDKTNVCDFVSVGDVSVKVIGADNQVLSCDVEIRHILEQIVAKLSIPPFLLGLSWSSTERMSAQQADILTSELEYYRTILNPVIRKICRYFLRSNGFGDSFEIMWSNINLQDETQLASARLDNAKAMQIEREIGEV